MWTLLITFSRRQPANKYLNLFGTFDSETSWGVSRTNWITKINHSRIQKKTNVINTIKIKLKKIWLPNGTHSIIDIPIRVYYHSTIKKEGNYGNTRLHGIVVIIVLVEALLHYYIFRSIIVMVVLGGSHTHLSVQFLQFSEINEV